MFAISAVLFLKSDKNGLSLFAASMPKPKASINLLLLPTAELYKNWASLIIC